MLRGLKYTEYQDIVPTNYSQKVVPLCRSLRVIPAVGRSDRLARATP